jgi:D-glycero-D-manno-heptose 1,7-bisphosphate phosphatase
MKLIIMDRDGTINKDSVRYIKSPEEWESIPTALEAIAHLNHAGWSVVVATNQSGIGRGLFDVMTLNAIHSKMHRMLELVGARVDAVIFCPHVPDDACTCRKPLPAMYQRIIQRYGLEPSMIPVVGDGPRDLHAAVAAGCLPHCVLTGKEGDRVDPLDFPENTIFHKDLMTFSNYIIAETADT